MQLTRPLPNIGRSVVLNVCWDVAPKRSGVVLVFAPIDRMGRTSLRLEAMEIPAQDVITLHQETEDTRPCIAVSFSIARDAPGTPRTREPCVDAIRGQAVVLKRLTAFGQMTKLGQSLEESPHSPKTNVPRDSVAVVQSMPGAGAHGRPLSWHFGVDQTSSWPAHFESANCDRKETAFSAPPWRRPLMC